MSEPTENELRSSIDFKAEMAQLEANYRRREKTMLALSAVILALVIAVCVLAVVKLPKIGAL